MRFRSIRTRGARRRTALVSTALVTVVTTMMTTVPVTNATTPPDTTSTTTAPEPEPEPETTTTAPTTEAPTTTAPPAVTTVAPETTAPTETTPPADSSAPETTAPESTEPVDSSTTTTVPTDAPVLSGVPLNDLALGAESVSGLPGVPQPPLQAFIEDFEAGQPSAPRSVADYQGASGTTYTADEVWTTGGAGVVVAYGDTAPPADWPGTPEEWAIARTLADAVGQWGGVSPSAANHVVAELPTADPGAGGVVLASSPISVTPGHYYTVALDVAAVNCAAPPAYDLALVVDGNEVPVSSEAFDVCATPGVVAGDVVIGTGVGSAPVLVTGDSTGIVVRNAQGAASDSVIDNVRLLDVTPQLDVELTAAEDAAAGDVVPLTFTVTNSADLGAKAGWSFTTTLPEGLVVADPPDGTADDGVEIAAEPGSNTITVSGDLGADAASTAITVNVVAETAGTYTLDAESFELVGLNAPGTAEVTFAEAEPDIGLFAASDFATWTDQSNTEATFTLPDGTTGTASMELAACGVGTPTGLRVPADMAHGAEPNYPGAWYTPTPPNPVSRLNLVSNNETCPGHVVTAVITFTFSAPVTNPVFHFMNLDAAQYRFLDGATPTRLSGNSVFAVTGASVNTPPVPAAGGGCQGSDGGNAPGRCGSVQINGTFTQIRAEMTDVDPSVAGGDGHTMMLSTDPALSPNETITCASDGAVFNTAYDGAGGSLPIGAIEPSWDIGEGDASGPASVTQWVPGTVTDGPGSDSVFAWTDSPFGNADWITMYPPNGQHWTGDPNPVPPLGTVDNYFRLQFDIAPEVPLDGFALPMDFYADNSVPEVWVNGVAQSATQPSLPQSATDPYFHDGFSAGTQASTTLADGFQHGANEIIVRVASGAGYTGFMAQMRPGALCDPPPPPFECTTTAYLIQRADIATPMTATGVNLVTGESQTVAADFYAGGINGVGFNPADGYLYGMLTEAPFGPVRIGSDFSVEELGLPSNWGDYPAQGGVSYNTGAFDSDGTYWVLEGAPANQPFSWAQIDLRPGSATYMEVLQAGTVNPGMRTISDWVYNPVDGHFYTLADRTGGAANWEIWRFNTTTLSIEVGILPPVPGSLIPTGSTMGAQYSDADGYLYASNNDTGRILRVDLATGAAEVFANGPAAEGNDGAMCHLASLLIDFGDAPDSYSTLLADDGPRHGMPGYDEATNTAPLMLGDENTIDPETDGLPGAAADGDDADGVDDEGAVAEPVTMTAGQPLSLTATATNDTAEDATLAGWIDLDGSGAFDAAELVTLTVPAGSGSADYTLDFPAGTTTADTYLRLRLLPGAVTDPLPTGPASAGEVEDYLVTVENFVDYGDAPDTFGTTEAASGPAHGIPGYDEATNTAPTMLGALIDAEADGQPTELADGDDTTGVDDEDGVAFNPPLGYPNPTLRTGLDPVSLQPLENTLEVNASADGFASVWVDWNLDGTFTADEQVAAAQAVTAGVNPITFAQGENPTHIYTHVRVRYSTDADAIAEPTGPAPDGEVEDYRVLVERLVQPNVCATGDTEHYSFTFNDIVDRTGTGEVGSTGRYPDVSVVNGVPVDMFVELIAGQLSQVPGTNGFTYTTPATTSVLGPQTAGWYVNVDATVRYSFFEAGTTTPVTINAAFTTNDLDGPPATQEIMTFSADDLAAYSVTQGSAVAIVESEGTTAFFGNGNWNGDPESRFQVVLEGISELEVRSEGGTTTGLGFNGNGALGIQPPACDELGDAPDSYGTLLADDGARHTVTPGIFLGSEIDFDTDGQPSELADGDDTTNLDDEDGVVFNPALEYPNPTLRTGLDPVSLQPIENTLEVTASADGFVSAWIDWNLNGVFDADEQVAAAQPVTAGVNTITFAQGDNPDDIFNYVRVRYSTDAAGVAEPTGAAPDGEVEDYRVLVERLVQPDVCAATGTEYYAFTFGPPVDSSGSGGVGTTARYRDVTVIDGVAIDMVVQVIAGSLSPTGQFGAAGDDAEWNIDGNATISYSFYEAGTTNPVSINSVFTVNDMDGTPELSLDEIATFAAADLASYAVTQGSRVEILEDASSISFVGHGNNSGDPESRFQAVLDDIDTFEVTWEGFGDSGFLFDGDGDLGIDPPACEDFGDAPESYGTLLADDGPRHTITPGLFLGELIDFDTDGEPTAAADGDDANRLADEDGVADPIVIATGQPTTVTVSATNDTDEPATLAGWIDLDGNGTFDAGELQTIAVPAGSGAAAYELTFPAGTATAGTYARFRLYPGDVTAPLPTGAAAAGEVEDYPVTVASLHVEKSSDPAEGTPVDPGEVVTYTVRVRNDGPVAVTDTVVDDMTGVIDDATYNGDADVTIGDVSYTEPELTWTGTLEPGEEAVITYSVTVFGGDGSVLTTITVLDTPSRQNADGWTVTEYNLDPGCATLEPPDGSVPFPAIWGDIHDWFGEGLSPLADQHIGGAGCYGTWPGYDAAPNSWVLTKTFESPEEGVATVLSTGFRADGAARVRINGVDAGLLGQWNRPAVDGTAQIPVTAGTNTVEIEVRDINGVNLVQGRLDIQIAELGDNNLENVVTGADCPDPAITDPEDPNYDPDCHNLLPVNRIDISKAVTSGPTVVGAGQYEVGYTITVTNSGAAEGVYDLNDALQYGAGLSVVSASIANTAPGDVAVNGAWNGVGDTVVATAVPIAGADGATPAVHTYVVTAVVDVPPGTSADATDCAFGPGEAGTGAFNTATMTTAGVPTEAEACAEVPTTEFDKELTSVTPNGDGTFTLVYALTVERTGGDGTYDLTDTLRYGDAVTVDSVTASNTTPGTVTTNPAFDGVADTLVVGDVVIGQGETHTYEVVVEATVDGAALTFDNTDCVLADGEAGTGFYNEAALDIDGDVHTDTACEPVPATTVTKAITAGPTALGGGTYELTYTITATNVGAGADVYDVTDELTYGAGITVDSATVVNTTPGDITVNPAWNGSSDTVVATDAAIAGAADAATPTTHTYTVTVVATVPADLPATAADCEVGPDETGSGFLNDVTLNGNSGESTAEACAPVPVTTIDKTLVDVVANGDGTWMANYTIDVTQEGADGTYDLTDELTYGESVTVETVTAANTAPGTVTINPAFDGTTDPTVATAVPITAGDTHSYTVAVAFSVDGATVTFANSDCELGTDESGTGLLNTATVTSNGQSSSDDECAPPPAEPAIDKTVTSGPTAVGDGTYEIEYTITATNAAAGAGSYDLTDELTYGDGITVVSAAVANTAPGDVTVNPAWNGIGDTTVATDVAIAPAVDAATPTVHTYTVTVVVDVPLDITDDAADCVVGDGEAGSGFLNTATLTSNGEPSEAEACPPVPHTDFTKELTSTTPNGDGTYTLDYTLTVTREGTDGTYDLTDELRLGEATTADSVTAANTAPGDVTVNPAFDGVADTTIATGVAITAGDTHTYTVSVVVSVAVEDVTYENSDCTLADGEPGTGAMNEATLTVDGDELTGEACELFPATTVDKTITEGPTALGGGQYEIVYTITATNVGAGDDVYDLTDELTYGAGITVDSATVVNTDPGDIAVNAAWNGTTDTTVATDVPIVGAADAATPTVHTYTVTVVATVPADLPPEAANCELDPGETGSGFLNTATLNGNSGESTDDECVPVPVTTIDKTLVDVVGNGDGTWTANYTIDVTQEGADGTYDLTDELTYGESVTVETVTAANTAPGTVTINPAFDGTTDPTIATAVPIAVDETHSYTVAVTFSVDGATVTFANSDCELGADESGTGLLNTATVTSNDRSTSDDECAPPPATPAIDKAVTSGPTALGDGTYEIEYTITATNAIAGSGTYDLADELTYGDGITVVSAAVANTAPGDITTNPAWDGIGDTTVATDAPIAGAVDAETPTVHTYTVTVVVDVPLDLTDDAADCEVGPGESGSGFLNTATLTSNGEPTDAEACPPVPRTDFDKELTGVVANGDGTFTISYELSVTRGGTDGIYDLADTLAMSEAVTVESVTAANTAPGDVTVNPAFDGAADPVIATGVAITDGATHVYVVDVVVSIDIEDVTFDNSDCTPTPGEPGTGALNTASLSIDGSERTDDACVEFPATTVNKDITEGPTAIGDGQYQLTYTITAANRGAGEDIYTVTDALTYGEGVTVVSATVENSTPGDVTVDPTWNGLDQTTVAADVPIDGATADGPAEHVYTVTVVFTVAPTITPEAADCEPGAGEAGTGLLNTATVNGQSGEASDDSCTEVPHTEFTKELASVVSNGDGTYDLTYELTATQSGSDSTYDLTDSLLLSEAVTAESVTASNTTPGDIAVNPDFDGQADTTVVTGVAIADGDTHVYEVVATVRVNLEAVTPGNSNCELEPGEAGTGAMNQATLTANGQAIDGEACEPFPGTTVAKTIVEGPTPLGDGTYELTYEITATNSGAGDDTYTVTDELTYGAGITVVSAAVTDTDPAITTNPAWDGTTDTTIVTDQPIAGATADTPTVHTYTVTVVAEAPATLEPGAGDCDVAPGEAGTGFLNTATLTGASGESTADDCVEPPSTSITKTIDAVIGNGDGTYTISYLLTVERTGNGPGYDLSDTLTYGDAVTVESVAITGAPDGVTANPAFNGQADPSIVADQAIADGETHVYAVDVVVSVEGAEVTFTNSDCTLTTDETGTGFLNTATLTVNDSETSDDECVPPPAEPLVDKAITEGPTPIGDGQYELTYEITVTNPGAGVGAYSVDDELLYGDGIEVVSATVDNTTGGSDPNPTWDGIDDTNVVTDAPIEAATDAGPAVHVYTVTVVAAAPADLTAEAADCELGGGEDGTGFLNSATLTTNGEPSEASDCVLPPITTIDKELAAVTPNGDGTFTLAYEITVTRTGTGAPYTLTDELTYGEAVTVDSVVASNTTPGAITVNPAFDGVADTTIAADVAIADGETHVYSVTVDATVDATEVTFANSDCELGAGESGTGFLNTATVSSNDSTVSDTECAPPPAVTVDKAVTSGPVPQGDGTFEVVYTLTATNTGAGEGVYTLTDALRFGEGITIESATVANTAPGDIVVDPAWNGLDATTVVADQAIGAASADGPNVHTYTVTVVVGIPADLPPEAADCELGPNETGTGLLNEATINGDSGPSSDTDCVPPPVTDFDKELTDITSLGGAQFELTYELTATRVSGGPGTYTLNDSLMLGESLTIDEVTAANTAPGDVATNPAFDGVTDTVIAADVAIDDGDVHTFTISVVVTVDIDLVTPNNSDCVLDPGEPGTGAMNQASLDVDGVVDEADTCIEFPSTTVIKEVVDGPVALGDGQYGISYLITVLNSGAGDDEYTLDDTLTYGEGITVETAAVSNATPGDITVNPDWNGLDVTNIVTGEPIAGAETEPVTHTYAVDVVVAVDPATTLEAGDCTLAPGEGGTGLLNQVAMTSATGDHEAEACEEPPLTDPFKELVSTTPNGDGTYTLVYELTVTRQGDGPGYDLTDELSYGGAVTVESVSVANTQPGDIVANPAFDGVADTAIVTDQAIADGDVHLYEVTVVASIDEPAITYENSACGTTGAGDSSGYLNTMAVSSNDVEVTDDACDPIAGITVDKEVTSGPTDLGDNRYEITYDIDVTNSGAGAGQYTLDDALQFADGVVVESATVANTAPGGIAVESGWNGVDETRLVTDEPIAGATAAASEVHTYTVTVVVDLSAGFSPEASDCVVDDPDAPATGLQNTATLTVDGEESSDDACTEIPGDEELTVSKVVSATTVQPNGNVGYTVTITNSGNVDFTDDNPAEAVDNLTDVLDDAVWLDNATATSGSLSFSAPNLTWTGALAVGETVTLTYSVRVNEVVTGPGELHNTVSAVLSNCPPGSGDPECNTLTRIPPPAAPPAQVTPDPVPVTG